MDRLEMNLGRRLFVLAVSCADNHRSVDDRGYTNYRGPVYEDTVNAPRSLSGAVRRTKAPVTRALRPSCLDPDVIEDDAKGCAESRSSRLSQGKRCISSPPLLLTSASSFRESLDKVFIIMKAASVGEMLKLGRQQITSSSLLSLTSCFHILS